MINQKSGKKIKLIEILLGIMLLLSAGVVFLHLLLPTVIINSIVILIYLVLFVEFLKGRDFKITPIHPNFHHVIIWFVLFVIHIGLFFFIRGSDDRFIYLFFWHAVMFTCFFLDISVIKGGIKVFSQIVFWIVLLAVINYLIALVGIDLPSYQFNISTRDTTYMLYPGTVRLFSQNYSIFGLTGFRLSGIFPEPSMFGIVCAFVLYSGVFKGRRIKQSVILLGLLLSLSTGAIILSLGLYLFSEGKIKAKLIMIFSLVCVALVIAFVVPKEIFDTFFVEKLSGDVIGGRVAGDFNTYYSDFLNFGDSKSILIGRGADILENNDFVASDYRGFLVKYGLIGVLILFTFIGSLIFFKGPINDKFTVAYIFVVIFAHRSWFVVSFIFLFYIYFLSIKNYKNYKYAQ